MRTCLSVQLRDSEASLALEWGGVGAPARRLQDAWCSTLSSSEDDGSLGIPPSSCPPSLLLFLGWATPHPGGSSEVRGRVLGPYSGWPLLAWHLSTGNRSLPGLQRESRI